jgi:Zn finger protein HypA/HybF involved in hydrogenase expression
MICEHCTDRRNKLSWMTFTQAPLGAATCPRCGRTNFKMHAEHVHTLADIRVGAKSAHLSPDDFLPGVES